MTLLSPSSAGMQMTRALRDGGAIDGKRAHTLKCQHGGELPPTRDTGLLGEQKINFDEIKSLTCGRLFVTADSITLTQQ